MSTAKVTALLVVIFGQSVTFLPAAAQVSNDSKEQTEPRASEVADVSYPVSISPGGRFVAEFGPQGNLSIRDLETGQTKALTEVGFPELLMNAVFSPDGERIAYAWHNELDFDDLRVTARVTPEPHLIYRDPATRSVWTKDWSPNGENILVTILKKDNTSLVALLPASGGAPQTIMTINANGQGLPEQMVFSPDGRYIAYDTRERTHPSDHDIFIVRADGTAPATLVQRPADDRLLGWSAEPEGIVFASDRDSGVDIFFLPVGDGVVRGTARRIERDIGQHSPLRLAPDGTYYFAVTHYGSNLYIGELDRDSGRIEQAPRMVVPALHNTGADWSPDGQFLAYVAPGEGVIEPSGGVVRGSWELAVRSLRDEQERRFSLKAAVLHQLRPLWSPDGKRLLAKGWDTDAYPREGVYGIDVESGAVTTLFSSASVWKRLIDWVEWRPDGNGLFYTAETRGPTVGIFSRDLSTGREQVLLRGSYPPSFYGLTASPDGRNLAFGIWDTNRRTSSLAVMSLPDGNRQILVEVELPISIAPPAWFPDSLHLAYESDGRLWRIPRDGGTSQDLGSLESPHYNQAGLSIHPNGRRFAFVGEEGRSSQIWMIRDLLSDP